MRVSELLRFFGIKSGLREDSKDVAVLRVVMDTKGSMTFSDIVNALRRKAPALELSDASIRHVIGNLVEQGLLAIEGKKTYRKRYTTGLQIIVSGLEHLKQKVLTEIDDEAVQLQRKREQVDSCDCASIAEELVERITGKSQRLMSRFIRGLDEFYRIVDESILSKSGKGDILRNSLLWLSPFATRSDERFKGILSAVEKGVEVRYIITDDLLKQGGLLRDLMGREGLQEIVGKLLEVSKTGLIDIRLYSETKDTYNFISLNDNRIAFVLTQNPVTAVYFSRELNPELIWNCIRVFDEIWENAPSFVDLLHASMKGKGDSRDLSDFIGGE